MEVIGSAIHINWGARPYRFREVMKLWTAGSILEGWQPKYALSDGIKNSQTKSNKISSAK
jgi:hypothetical protein